MVRRSPEPPVRARVASEPTKKSPSQSDLLQGQEPGAMSPKGTLAPCRREFLIGVGAACVLLTILSVALDPSSGPRRSGGAVTATSRTLVQRSQERSPPREGGGGGSGHTAGETLPPRRPLQLASGLQLWEAPTLTAVRGFPDALVLGWLQNSHRRNVLVNAASTTDECSGPPRPWPPPQQQRRRQRRQRRQCPFAISDQFISDNAAQPCCAVAAALENHRRYAATHGYSIYHTTDLDPRHRTPYNTFKDDAKFNKLRRVRSLLEHHEWVLQIDVDALFVDFSAKLEDIVSRWAGAGHEGVDLLFSGNALVINSGVLLFRRSPWTDNLLVEATQLGVSRGTRTEPEWRNAGKPGLGGIETGGLADNWALAVVLAGCNRSSSAAELSSCCRRADGGNGNTTFKNAIHAGDQAVADTALSADAANHTRLLPRALFQSYQASEAQFVLHCPGGQHWQDRLLWRLAPVEELNRFKWDTWPVPNRHQHSKEHAIALALRATSCSGGQLVGCFATADQHRRHCQAADPDLYRGRKTLLDRIESAPRQAQAVTSPGTWRRVTRVGANLRCGRLPWLNENPAAAAGCLALVQGQPAANCSHTCFVYADLGDRNCACAPPHPALCDDPGSKDVIGAAIASLYKAADPTTTGPVKEAHHAGTPDSLIAMDHGPQRAVRTASHPPGATLRPQLLTAGTANVTPPIRLQMLNELSRIFEDQGPKFAETVAEQNQALGAALLGRLDETASHLSHLGKATIPSPKTPASSGVETGTPSAPAWQLVAIVSTFNRDVALQAAVAHYSRLACVTSVTVVWHDPDRVPPRWLTPHATVLRPANSSLNNRFDPALGAGFDAAFHIDDDELLAERLVCTAAWMWGHDRSAVCAFDPRHVDFATGEYTWNSVCGARCGVYNTAFVTKGAIFSTDYLALYFADRWRAARNLVTEHVTGEDLLMSAVLARFPLVIVNARDQRAKIPADKASALGKRHPRFAADRKMVARTIGALMTVHPRDQAVWIILKPPAGCTTTEDVCLHQMCYNC